MLWIRVKVNSMTNRHMSAVSPPTVGRLMADTSPTLHRQLAVSLPTNGQLTANSRPTHGQHVLLGHKVHFFRGLELIQ